MVQHFGLLLILFLTFSASAQDERYYRQILNGDLPGVQEATKIPVHQFNVKGASYLVDLNGDGFEEIIQPQKRDGVDWLEIKDSTQRKIFEGKFLAMGGESSIYKVKLAHLSLKTKVLIVYLDEGRTAGKRIESTARIYLVTFDNNDFSTMQMTAGPHHFHEKEKQREQYWRRDYAVELRDLDNDGVRDVVVEFNHIQRIMRYKGQGIWDRL